jgi:mannose-6-phosphate isomerase-like protein (cupin superfamily)
MNRRAFVTTAITGFPLAALAEVSGGGSGNPDARGFVVRAGQARASESLRMFDRSWMDFKVLTADTGGGFFLLEQRELRKFGPPRHFHHDQDEWFYAMEGHYDVEVGDEKFRLGPGDLLFAPRKIPHVWAHIEEEPGRLMVAFQPAGLMESFFRKFTQFPQMPPMAEMKSLFRDHGMEIVGPPLKVS